MINKKLKRLLSITLTAIIVSSFFALNVGAYEPALSWYCRRTKDHTQPKLPQEFEFITKHGAFYADRSNQDPNAKEKTVYLTFDAGYENGNVRKTLDVLKMNNTPAAFFILSNLVKSEPDLIKRMGEEGHLVCNHTSKHKDMSTLKSFQEFTQELTALEIIYKECTGRELAKYFRPPEGKFSESTLEFSDKMGYKTIFWSFAYADWDNQAQPDKSAAKRKILDNMHNGAVILLHPTSSTNAEILDDVIKELKSQGYRFGTLDELVSNNSKR